METVEMAGVRRLRTVQVTADPDAGFGLRIASHEYHGKHLTRIVGLTEGGPAARTGQLHCGDVLLKVNGESTVGREHEAALAAFKLSGGVVDLVVVTSNDDGSYDDELALADLVQSHGPPERVERLRTVTLERGEGGYGLRLATTTQRDGRNVTQIARLEPLGPAAASGQLFGGDVVLKVNGASTIGSSHEEAVGALRTQATVELLVVTPNDNGTYDDELALANLVETHGDPAKVQRIRTVALERGGGSGEAQGFGLQIATAARVGTQRVHAVTRVTPGGAAASSRQVFTGDVVLMINGVPVLDLDHDAAVAPLRTAPSATLVLVTPNDGSFADELALIKHVVATNPEGIERLRRVRLEKGASGFGLRVAPFLLPDGRHVTRIAHLAEGGPAAASAQVFGGDVVLQVNGVSTVGSSHEDAINAFRTSQLVDLVVVTPNDDGTYDDELALADAADDASPPPAKRQPQQPAAAAEASPQPPADMAASPQARPVAVLDFSMPSDDRTETFI